MYSVVLLMALSGSVDAPAFGGGCDGCSGCSGCSGWSCSGCDGCSGGGHKLFGGHGCCGGGHKLFGGHGCSGSCSGCSGSCHGGHSKHSGHGCCGGCDGCHGGGLFQKMKNRHGCCGGYSGCCGGGCTGCTGCTGGHAAIIETSPSMPKAEAAAPATIVVSLPTEAKLTIDDNATSSTSERRVFVSPALEAGQEYYYTLKAEVKGEVRTERVAVRAGQEVNVKIEFPSSVASK